MIELKQFDYTPILGWSLSRYDTFQTCKRQYFYSYYARYDNEYSRDRIDRLKNMTSIPLAIGSIVHVVNKTLLERLLRSEGKIDKSKYIDYTHRNTESYCRNNVFCEVYYNEIAKINIDEIFDDVSICLNNFLNSDRFIWVTEKAVKAKNDWLIEPPGYGETRIDGMKAYFKVDFLFPVNNRIFILDWKTGKSNERKHCNQLLGYTAWASYQYDVDPTKITSIVSYLKPKYVENDYVFNEYDVQEFSMHIRNETQEMYNFCVDIEENIPKKKDIFIKTQNTKICENCNFRELCC